MTKKIIRLTESDLHYIIHNVLNEAFQRVQGYFNVRGQLSRPVPREEMNDSTQHMSDDRSARVAMMKQRLNSAGSPAYSFVVDTGHPMGDEVHTITEKAVIIVQNKNTGKVVTVFPARPAQVARYWKSRGKALPADETFRLIMRFAQNNVERGLNK